MGFHNKVHNPFFGLPSTRRRKERTWSGSMQPSLTKTKHEDMSKGLNPLHGIARARVRGSDIEAVKQYTYESVDREKGIICQTLQIC